MSRNCLRSPDVEFSKWMKAKKNISIRNCHPTVIKKYVLSLSVLEYLCVDMRGRPMMMMMENLSLISPTRYVYSSGCLSPLTTRFYSSCHFNPHLIDQIGGWSAKLNFQWLCHYNDWDTLTAEGIKDWRDFHLTIYPTTHSSSSPFSHFPILNSIHGSLVIIFPPFRSFASSSTPIEHELKWKFPSKYFVITRKSNNTMIWLSIFSIFQFRNKIHFSLQVFNYNGIFN